MRDAYFFRCLRDINRVCRKYDIKNTKGNLYLYDRTATPSQYTWYTLHNNKTGPTFSAASSNYPRIISDIINNT